MDYRELAKDELNYILEWQEAVSQGERDEKVDEIVSDVDDNDEGWRRGMLEEV